MGQTERLCKLKSQLDAGRCLQKARALQEFGISPATFERDLAHLRDRTALLRRQRLHIDYHGRGRDAAQERRVSPQRLAHYRDNWYLDAWCHLRKGLRSFAVDAMRSERVLDKAAIDVSEYKLDAVLGAGYGIFAGRKVQWAELRFSPERTRWVAAETWHPKQSGRIDADASCVLPLPCADPREPVMDTVVPHARGDEPRGCPQALRVR